MAANKVMLDRECPECGGKLVCLYTKRMTHVHCENECGYGLTCTNAEVPVERYATPEEAYDDMLRIPMFEPM